MKRFIVFPLLMFCWCMVPGWQAKSTAQAGPEGYSTQTYAYKTLGQQQIHGRPVPKALVSFYGYGDITGPWYSAPDSFYNQRPRIEKEIAFKAVGDSIVSNAPSRSPDYSRGQFYLYCRQNGLWPLQVSGHDPHSESDWFLPYEPLRHIDAAYPPTVLLHGESDTDVPCWPIKCKLCKASPN